MDCFTDWPAVISLDHGTTSTQVITAVRQSFCRTAIPDVIWADGGPQFTSKLFNDFVRCWRFVHKVSSPRNPQSNGKAEATVKSMKKLLHTAGLGDPLTTKSSVKLCYSIITLPVGRMDYLLLKICSGTLCRISYQLIIVHFY